MKWWLLQATQQCTLVAENKYEDILEKHRFEIRSSKKNTNFLYMLYNLLPNETLIDAWQLCYTAPWGDKYLGKLTVTENRLIFKPDNASSAEWKLASFTGDYIEFLKDHIINIKQKNTLINNKIIITLSDNSSHIFNYGVMNTDKIVAAIRLR